MGWKASAAGKRLVCASATSRELDAPAATVVIDMNAVCRRDLGFLGGSVTPTMAAMRVWNKYVRPHPDATLFYFAFDTPDRVPPARTRFLQDCRYRGRTDTLPEVWTIAPTTMSITWAVAFAISKSPTRSIGRYFRTIYPMVDELGWKAALCRYTGLQDIDAFYAGFEALMAQPLKDRMSMLETLED